MFALPASAQPSAATARQLAAAVVVCAWALVPGGEAQAGQPVLTLESTTWGIGGHLSERSFNPVWLQLRNDGDATYDGQIELRPVRPFGSATEHATHRSDLYLLPGETRRVPFTVFLDDGTTNWTLRWGDPNEVDVTALADAGSTQGTANVDRDLAASGFAAETPLAPVPPFKRGIVRLAPPKARSDGWPRVAPAELPAKSTAMEAVSAVLLADEVALQPSQQKGLLDWIRAGGTLIRAENPPGTLPNLTGELAAIQSPSARTRFGRGTVWTVRKPLAELDRDSLRRRLASLQHGSEPTKFDLTAEADLAKSQGRPAPSTGGMYVHDADDGITLQLVHVTRPRSYALFFVPLVVAYGGLLAILSRKARLEGWRWTKAAAVHLGLAAVAAVALVAASPAVGQTASRSATVSVVSPFGDGRAMVRQWEVRQQGLPRTVEIAARSDQQVVAVQGRSVRSTVDEGQSQSATVSPAPLTMVKLRARGIVTLTDAESLAVSRLAVRPATNANPIVRVAPPTPVSRYPAAVLLAESEFTTLAPSERHRDLRSGVVHDGDHPFAGRAMPGPQPITHLGPLSMLQVQRPNVWGQLAAIGSGDRERRRLMLDCLMMVPFVDERATGAFTRQKMAQPPGRAKLLLAGPLRPDVDLLGDGEPDANRDAMTIWILQTDDGRASRAE